MATLAENAAAVKAAQVAIDAAIVAKGGETDGGLNNAAAAIAALPSGGEVVPLSVTANGTYTPPSGVDGYAPVYVNVTTEGYVGADPIMVYDTGIARDLTVTIGQPGKTTVIDWGDGTTETVGSWSNPAHTYAKHGIYVIKATGAERFSARNYGKAVSDIYDGTSVSLYQFGQSGNESLGNCMAHKNIARSPVGLINTNVFAIDSVITVGSSHSGNISGNVNIDARSCSKFALSRWAEPRCRKIDFGDNVVEIGHYGFCGTSSNIMWIFAKKFIMNNGGEYCFMNFKGARLPNEIDMTGSSVGNSNMFSGCTALIQLPTSLKSNFSLDFSPCTGILIADSVAEFTDGTIVGGFVYNLNTCPNEGQTITLNATIKALFNATEQAEIAATLAAKNWTLAW